MSGFLGTAINVISGLGTSVNALSGLLSGTGGAVISIGGITLQDWEIPEQVSFGGQQQMTVHKFVGGARIVDVMGRDDDPIQWSGMMIGPGAVQRARQIDQLRRNGAQQTLIFGDFAENVVIASFQAQYRRSSWIGEYHISCVVVSDPSSPSGGASLQDAASGGLLGALGSLGEGISSIGSTVAPILQGAQQAVTQIGNVVLPVTNALGIHVPFLSQAQTLLSSGQGAVRALTGLGGGLTGLSAAATSLSSGGGFLSSTITQTGNALSSLAGIAGPGKLVADAPSLNAAVAAAGEHAVAVQTAGQVGQTLSVLNAMTSDSPRASAGFYGGDPFSPGFGTPAQWALNAAGNAATSQ